MGNQAGIIIRNVKNELFHSAKRLILNEVKGIECLLINESKDNDSFAEKIRGSHVTAGTQDFWNEYLLANLQYK